MERLVLHNFFRSSTSVRLRAALRLKGLQYDYVAYSLRDGETRRPDFWARNPQGLVPALELADGTVLTQSLAIIEWLDETHPEPPLLPPAALDRARVRAIAYAVACEIHPLNNLRVLERLRTSHSADEATVAAWFRHWVAETFGPIEHMLAQDERTGRFCHGDAPGLADLCLYAQVLNNRRFDVDMTPFPTIQRIFEASAALDAFQQSAPNAQPDAV